VPGRGAGRIEGLTIVTGDELIHRYDTPIVDARR
jgi:hypothetical protein